MSEQKTCKCGREMFPWHYYQTEIKPPAHPRLVKRVRKWSCATCGAEEKGDHREIEE